MPCNSDYMEPRPSETMAHETAKHIVYVCEQTGDSIHPIVRAAAESYFNADVHVDELVAMLCEKVRGLPQELFDSIVYNAHDPRSRALADWWERHQKADAKRAADEAAARQLWAEELYQEVTTKYPAIIKRLKEG